MNGESVNPKIYNKKYIAYTFTNTLQQCKLDAGVKNIVGSVVARLRDRDPVANVSLSVPFSRCKI